MYDVSDLRKGLKVEIDGEPYEIVDFEFRKPGKGQALYRCKLKNMFTGATIDKTYRSADKVEKAELQEIDMIFSYVDNDHYVFLDAETFEQVFVDAQVLGDKRLFLQPDTACKILFYKDTPLEVSIPVFVEARVAATETGARGDTATNTTKPATLENGYDLHVPLFVNEGDIIKIDTRTGEYSERVKKA
ncbi:MAG: elongation factor P [Lentisphaeria bacterium]